MEAIQECDSQAFSSRCAKDTIPYSIGVKRGDVMAPVLFIVLMQAMAETLKE
jgi:hypothetical protein